MVTDNFFCIPENNRITNGTFKEFEIGINFIKNSLTT